MSDGRTVLVVDDDSDIRTTLAMIVESEGYRALTASNGRDALALILSQTPDVVLLDLHMPIMTGWELIEACRSDALTRDLPLIVISAVHGRTAVEQCDIQGFVPKPFEIDHVLDMLKDALG